MRTALAFGLGLSLLTLGGVSEAKGPHKAKVAHHSKSHKQAKGTKGTKQAVADDKKLIKDLTIDIKHDKAEAKAAKGTAKAKSDLAGLKKDVKALKQAKAQLKKDQHLGKGKGVAAHHKGANAKNHHAHHAVGHKKSH